MPVLLVMSLLAAYLIGFSGSPWTLATYMVEGGHQKIPQSKALLYDNPQAMHMLLDKLAQSVSSYLMACTGAQAVQIFYS